VGDIQTITGVNLHVHKENVENQEYYSAIRKKKVLSFVTVWIYLKVTVLKEIARHRKINIAWSHF
jgi:hypothetical protein